MTGLLGRVSALSPGAASAGRAIAFLDGHPVLAQPIALPGRGARRLRTAPDMGDTTTNEGRCEKQPAEVLGASGLC